MTSAEHAADWRNRAACRPDAAVPTNWFDLDAGLPLAVGVTATERMHNITEIHRRHTVALAVCSICPVAAECLNDAILNHGEGVRGGQILGRHPRPRLCVLCGTEPAATPTATRCRRCRQLR